jgi:hypothetical protein
VDRHSETSLVPCSFLASEILDRLEVYYAIARYLLEESVLRPATRDEDELVPSTAKLCGRTSDRTSLVAQ